jgi:hypothetical protein
MPGRVAEIKRFSGTSGANGAQTVSATSTTHRLKLLWVTAKYSAAPTQTGVLVTINNILGTAFDTQISAGTANLQNNIYIPDGDLIIEPGDAFDVITSSVVIACEVIG